MLITIVTWSAGALVAFCVLFFILSGCILLLDTIHLITIREKARTQISRVLFGTILAGVAAAAMFLFSPETLQLALDEAQEERTRAVVAEAQTESIVTQIRQAPEIRQGGSVTAQSTTPSARASRVQSAAIQSVVFIHTFQDSRRSSAAAMAARLQAAGYLAPGIDGLDIRVSDDQVRYFHSQSKASAEAVADLVGIDSVRFVEGFEARVGVDHLEIWLAP